MRIFDDRLGYVWSSMDGVLSTKMRQWEAGDGGLPWAGYGGEFLQEDEQDQRHQEDDKEEGTNADTHMTHT